jgi:tRNA dimethylallyltransferase
MSPANLIVVLGPTASGKTHLGVQLAKSINGEIISADSRQVFRGMDIGTGKDLEEYGDTPYHLVDILEPGEEFSVFAFQKLFYLAFENIRQRGKRPMLVGGTGLYLDAALRGYRLVEVPENPDLREKLTKQPLKALQERLVALRPEQHNRTDLNDRKRLVRAIEIAEGEQEADTELPDPPELKPAIFGIRWDRAILRQRITARLKQRLDEGMVTEVERLRAQGVSWEQLDYYGLEYRFIARHLQGLLNHNDMFQKLNSAIHQFAKRQETWFRHMERQGTRINWLDGKGDMVEQALSIIESHSPS